jgi:hypothetical protein
VVVEAEVAPAVLAGPGAPEPRPERLQPRRQPLQRLLLRLPPRRRLLPLARYPTRAR